MPIVAACPDCGFKGNVPDQFKGKKVKCRACQKMFVVGGEAAKQKSNPDLVEMQVVEDKPGSKHDMGGSAFGDFDFNGAPAKTSGSAQGTPRKMSGSASGAPRKPASSAPGTLRKPSSSAPGTMKKPAVSRGPSKKKQQEPAPVAAIVLGVLALILGGAAFGVGSAGLAALLGVPLAGLGFLLAVGGVVMAWGKPGFGILAPIAGLLLCLGALPYAGYVSYQLVASGVLGDKDQNSTAVAQNSDTRTAPPTPPVDTRPRETRPVATNPGTTKPEPPPPPPDEYADAGRGQSAQIGALRVRLKAVEMAPVPGKPGKDLGMDKRLLIRLEIENTSADKGVDYDGWGITPATDGKPGPFLKDQLDAAINRVVFKDDEVVGQIAGQTMQPKKVYDDVIVFEVPTDKAQQLKLELPATNFDKLSGKFKFLIPRSMLLGKPIVPKEPGKKEPPADLAKYFKDQQALMRKPLAVERERGLKALADIGPHAAPLAPEIATMLAKDGNEGVRAVAAHALGEIGPAAKEFIPVLIAALKDDFFETKANAATALGQMGPLAIDAIKDLAPLLNSKDEKVPLAARRAILRIDPKYKLPPMAKN